MGSKKKERVVPSHPGRDFRFFFYSYPYAIPNGIGLKEDE